jgi:hypothetical protein
MSALPMASTSQVSAYDAVSVVMLRKTLISSRPWQLK